MPLTSSLAVTLNKLFSAHVEAKIAVSSAGLLVVTIWQNHRCSTLRKGHSGICQKLKLSTKSGRLKKFGANLEGAFQDCSILFGMQPCSNGNAGLHLFCLILLR